MRRVVAGQAGQLRGNDSYRHYQPAFLKVKPKTGG
jgi:hypothetical protein